MIESIYTTPYGDIHYWINGVPSEGELTLVFLPGLTADHRLFEKQLEYFKDKIPFLVWDAPGHGSSWPFELTFSLADKAKWLDSILRLEEITSPVIVGQSMGGYVGQAYAQLFPETLKGFVVIDSAPLQREYLTSIELWLLKRMEPIYRWWPWKSLLKLGTSGVAVSEYGRTLMRDIMMTYDGDKDRYAKLTGHGYKILAEAIEADLPYKTTCPTLLICGEKDQAGSCLRYNKEWHKRTGLPIVWVKDAGHNSNTDKPSIINHEIEKLLDGIKKA